MSSTPTTVTGKKGKKRKAAALAPDDASSSAVATDAATDAAADAAAATDNAQLRSMLECPVCYNTMFPPIRQCAEGHNFCDKCCTKLMNSEHDSARKCPSCRVRLRCPVARARNLEVWASEVGLLVECDHHPCRERFPYGEHAAHKATCVGQTVACPKAGCCWRGEPHLLGQHLQSEEGGHGLLPCAVPARYSARHDDYSTTLVFKTRRKPEDTRRWRPPRQLIELPPNARLGTGSVSFCVALWKEAGPRQPLLAAIQALRPPSHEELPFSYDLSVSACTHALGLEPRPSLRTPRASARDAPLTCSCASSWTDPRQGVTNCVSRVSAVGPVPELDKTEVWRRPALNEVQSPVLVADQAAHGIFNTVGLGPVCDSLQRFELHVRLTPITPDRHPDPEVSTARNGRSGSGEEGRARLPSLRAGRRARGEESAASSHHHARLGRLRDLVDEATRRSVEDAADAWHRRHDGDGSGEDEEGDEYDGYGDEGEGDAVEGVAEEDEDEEEEDEDEDEEDDEDEDEDEEDDDEYSEEDEDDDEGEDVFNDDDSSHSSDNSSNSDDSEVDSESDDSSEY